MKKFSLETNEYLPQIKNPIYIFHGTNDQLIPVENSIRLKKLLKSNAYFYPLKNQEHIGVNENEDFQKQLKRILE